MPSRQLSRGVTVRSAGRIRTHVAGRRSAGRSCGNWRTGATYSSIPHSARRASCAWGYRSVRTDGTYGPGSCGVPAPRSKSSRFMHLIKEGHR
jgi:hypothetical protein